jgi:hypothetical protein
MPERETVERAQEDAREGKSPDALPRALPQRSTNAIERRSHGQGVQRDLCRTLSSPPIFIWNNTIRYCNGPFRGVLEMDQRILND